MEDADVPEKVRIAYKNCGLVFENWGKFILNKNSLEFYKILRSIKIVSRYVDDEKYLKALSELRKEILKKCDARTKEKIRLINQSKIMTSLINKRNY